MVLIPIRMQQKCSLIDRVTLRPRVSENSFFNGARLPPLLTQHSFLIHAFRFPKHINGPVGHWRRSADICDDVFPLGYGAQSCLQVFILKAAEFDALVITNEMFTSAPMSNDIHVLFFGKRFLMWGGWVCAV